MWRPVAALRLNSTPVIACYYPFILYFCGVSDCILNENIIIIIPLRNLESDGIVMLVTLVNISLLLFQVPFSLFCQLLKTVPFHLRWVTSEDLEGMIYKY